MNNKSPSGIICAAGSRGGAGGGGSGSMPSDAKEATYTKSESFSSEIEAARQNEFELTAFVQSLKIDVENEIARSGAAVTRSEILNPLGFQIEYAEQEARGQIEITAGFTHDRYLNLHATLRETTQKENAPFIEERNRRPPLPTGNFHVVPFAGEKEAAAEEFLKKGIKDRSEIDERVRLKSLRDYETRKEFPGFIETKMDQAVVYEWKSPDPGLPAKIQKVMREAMYGDENVPAEYHQYSKIYFLNDAALQAYHELVGEINVLEIIPAEEVVKISKYSTLSFPYIAKDK